MDISYERIQAAAVDVNRILELDPQIEPTWTRETITECLRGVGDMIKANDSLQDDTWKVLGTLGVLKPALVNELRIRYPDERFPEPIPVPEYEPEHRELELDSELEAEISEPYLGPAFESRQAFKPVNKSRTDWLVARLKRMEWKVKLHHSGKWEIKKWVAELRKTGTPWAILLKGESLKGELVILDRGAFEALVNQADKNR